MGACTFTHCKGQPFDPSRRTHAFVFSCKHVHIKYLDPPLPIHSGRTEDRSGMFLTVLDMIHRTLTRTELRRPFSRGRISMQIICLPIGSPLRSRLIDLKGLRVVTRKPYWDVSSQSSGSGSRETAKSFTSRTILFGLGILRWNKLLVQPRSKDMQLHTKASYTVASNVKILTVLLPREWCSILAVTTTSNWHSESKRRQEPCGPVLAAQRSPKGFILVM